MSGESYSSVWDAIEDDPVVAENLRLRSTLMIEIQQHIERHKLTQARAARLFKVTQPRMSDLKRGKIDLFSLDTLVNMASAAGLRVNLRLGSSAHKLQVPPEIAQVVGNSTGHADRERRRGR